MKRKAIALPKSGKKCYITQAQINSIISARDDMTAMLGCADDDSYWRRYIRNIDRFIENNHLQKKGD